MSTREAQLEEILGEIRAERDKLQESVINWRVIAFLLGSVAYIAVRWSL